MNDQMKKLKSDYETQRASIRAKVVEFAKAIYAGNEVDSIAVLDAMNSYKMNFAEFEKLVQLVDEVVECRRLAENAQEIEKRLCGLLMNPRAETCDRDIAQRDFDRIPFANQRLREITNIYPEL